MSNQDPHHVQPEKIYSVLIVGGGAGGIAVAASLHKRDRKLEIAIVEPSDTHHYQPGWTMVGGGVFRPEITAKAMAKVMPDFVTWHQQQVVSLEPDQNCVTLSDGTVLGYKALVLAPGLELNWAGIEGLTESLGQNGVTSKRHCVVQPAADAHQMCRRSPESPVSVIGSLAPQWRAR